MADKTFKKLHNDLKLSHHPYRRSRLYLEWAFKNIDFEGKRVLDIGGGNGIYSYYAKYKGAAYCLNLEPFAAGSGNIEIIEDSTLTDLKIDLQNLTLQEFNTDNLFDIIILHDSINHLDEDTFSNIHTDQKSFNTYSTLVSKIRSLLTPNGKVLVADCSRVNFFAALDIKNPVAPTIEWHIHQHPPMLTKLFEQNGFKLEKLRWSPFKRFDKFGQFLSKIGFPISYFMQSHFNLVFKTNES